MSGTIFGKKPSGWVVESVQGVENSTLFLDAIASLHSTNIGHSQYTGYNGYFLKSVQIVMSLTLQWEIVGSLKRYRVMDTF